MSNFNSATVTNYSLKLRTLVFSAGTLPIPFGSENTLAEQAVLFGPIGAVIDGFRLADLAKRPTANVIRAGQANLDGTIVIDPVVNRLNHFWFAPLWYLFYLPSSPKGGGN